MIHYILGISIVTIASVEKPFHDNNHKRVSRVNTSFKKETKSNITTYVRNG